MSVSAILDDIGNATKLKIPTTTSEIPGFIRRANKRTCGETVWKQMSSDSQAYLLEAFKCLKSGTTITPPPDFVDHIYNNGQSPGAEDEYEPAPSDLSCLSTHTVYNLVTLISMRENDQIKLPEFQRKFVWGKESKQGFLRSLMAGIPTTNIMMAVDANEDRYILDGFQRMSTLVDFKNGKLTLGLGPQYPNYSFQYLPAEEQNKFLHKSIVVQEIRSEKKHWPYIFRQINKGGMPLNSMEIRRATYQHELIFMLDTFTETNEWWIGLFGRNTRYKGLQALLRAMAMHSEYASYNKPLDLFLDRYCDKICLEPWDESAINDLHQQLNTLFRSLYAVSGKTTFRLAAKKPVNLGMIDVVVHMGLLLLDENRHITDSRLGKMLEKYRQTIRDTPAMIEALTVDTSGRHNVAARMAFGERLVNAGGA